MRSLELVRTDEDDLLIIVTLLSALEFLPPMRIKFNRWLTIMQQRVVKRLIERLCDLYCKRLRLMKTNCVEFLPGQVQTTLQSVVMMFRLERASLAADSLLFERFHNSN